MLDHKGAYLLEVMVGKENNVFPMVPQGCSVAEIRFKSMSMKFKKFSQISTPENLCRKQEYTITVYTENQIGLLNRIAIIFSRRKINIESLNTSPSEVEAFTALPL